MILDISGLDSQVFLAITDTSDRNYVYMCNMQTNVSEMVKKCCRLLWTAGRIYV